MAVCDRILHSSKGIKTDEGDSSTELDIYAYFPNFNENSVYVVDASMKN